MNGKRRLQLECEFNASLDNLSLKLFSRHNAGGSEDNRYGGMGLAFSHGSVECKEETYHNNHKTVGSKSLAKKIPDGKFTGLRFDCSLDLSSKKFKVEGFIDYDLNNNWVQVCTFDWTSKASGVNDKPDLYCWIRTNGSNPKDVGLRNEVYSALA